MIYMQNHTILYSTIYNQLYMSTIITTSQLQKNIGEVTSKIGEKSYIVTNRGEGKMIILPYYDGCDKIIDEYMEDFEMYCNREKLIEKAKKSLESGESDFVI